MGCGGSRCRLGVLASGSGTNLEAIARAIDDNDLPAAIVIVISDKPGAPALERAARRRIRTLVVEERAFVRRRDYDRAVVEALEQAGVDLVVLAGYMKLAGPEMVDAFRGRMINVHPSLLPSFPGTSAVDDALAHGVKVSGATVHFVDEGLDTGPIITQEAVEVLEGDTPGTLHQRIHLAEYRLLPRAIRLFAGGRLVIEGRRVKVLPG